MTSDHISLETLARLEGINYDTLKKRVHRARIILRKDESDSRRRVVKISDLVERGILSQKGYQVWLREQVSGAWCLGPGEKTDTRHPTRRPEPLSGAPTPETCSITAAGAHGADPNDVLAPATSSILPRHSASSPFAADPAISNPLPISIQHKSERSPQPLLPFARPTSAQVVALAGIPLRFHPFVDKWLTFMGEVQNGTWKRREEAIINGCTIKSRQDYILAVAPQWGLSVTEFYRKQRTFKQIQKDPSIPQEKKWGAWAKTLIPKPRPGRSTSSFFVQEENLWMFGKLYEFYMNQAKLSISAAHRMLLDEIAARQRAHGLGHLYDRPTESQCRTALYNFISTPELALAREGAKAYNDLCAPYLSRDYSTLRANDLWVTDQRQVDVRMRDGGNRLGRIWMVSFMDVASERVLGAAFGPVLSSDLVMLAATMALERAGIPGAMQMDLGKEFNCTAFNGSYRKLSGEALYRDAVGLWERLGVQVVKAIGRNPQTKTIERWHRIVGDQFDRRFPGWCGSNTAERPEKLQTEESQHAAWLRGEAAETPLVSIGDYIATFFHWVDADARGWNAGARGKGKIRRGMTPLEAWNVKRPAEGLRTISESELEMATAEHRFVKVARGGQVNLTFFGQTVEYVAPELFLKIGEEVEAIVSRRTFRRITVVYPITGGTEQCVAELKPQLEWLPENREELRAAMRCKAAVRRAIRVGSRASNLSLAAANPVEMLAAQASAPAREALPGQKLFGAPAPNGQNEISGAEITMQRLSRRATPRFANDLAAKALEMEEEA